ncbi:MAG TPA: biopolymer transporter Tol [Puia sp.]|jgi:hypothetical protein
MYLQKSFLALILFIATYQVSAQDAAAKVVVPDWALPGSATHKQVPPPANFHRATRTENIRLGIFEGQSDVGAALVPGSSSYNKATKQYTIVSAGYNVWYQRDEFRYLWKKMSGDVSLAADIDFPDTAGYDDRKAFVIIRQSLNDDSKEAVVALHGGGLLHLAWRPGTAEQMKEVRANNRKGLPDLVSAHVRRIGIEKHGNSFALFVSNNGEPMHQVGDPIQLQIDNPFYVGIGFCSHLPAKTDKAVFSNVVLENKAGKL